jgi:hypothetical protein
MVKDQPSRKSGEIKDPIEYNSILVRNGAMELK